MITGASSCSGRHAVQYLQATGDIEIHGTTRRLINIDGLHDCHLCDFRNKEDVQRVVNNVKPDTILHLAGTSDPSDPESLIQTNINGTWQLLESCSKLEHSVNVMVVGSAAGFGEMKPEEIHLSGSRTCEPGSLYGVSREAQMAMGRLLDGRNGLSVFLCRTFNLIGPGISSRYVPSALAIRIANALANGEKELELRDMDAVRDFIDVRDAVAAYFQILQHGRSAYAYSVGTGQPITIKGLSEHLADALGAGIRFTAPPGPHDISRTGIKRSVSDSSVLKRETNWLPVFKFGESLSDMLAELPLPLSNRKKD